MIHTIQLSPGAAPGQSKQSRRKDPTPAQPEPEPAKAATAPKLSREKMDKPELTNRNEALRARGSRATIIADRLLPRIGYTPERKTREQGR